MELIPFTLNVNGESRTVLAPNRKTAIITCEKDFRRSNNLPRYDLIDNFLVPK